MASGEWRVARPDVLGRFSLRVDASAAKRSRHSPLAIRPSLERKRPFLHHYRLAPNPHRSDRAVLLVRLQLENARTAHLEALLHDPAQRAVATRIARGEIAAQS